MNKVLFITLVFLFPVVIHSGPHTVQKGETFEDIARLYNLPLDSILHSNPDTEAYSGLTIEVPLSSLVYDLGESNTFRFFQYRHKENIDKGVKKYRKGKEKLEKMFLAIGKKKESLKFEAITCFEEAVSHGNINALYQLGCYKVHGSFYPENKAVTFNRGLNENITEFKEGIEYLQIAAVSGHLYDALTELAIACGHEDSPIRNPYLCVSMLEQYKEEYNIPVNSLLCYMYENGYGINRDYLKAYVYCPSLTLSSGDAGKTHREEILEKIEALNLNFESAKYGVGLDPEMMFTIGCSYYHNEILEPEGLFWLHRAVRGGCSDASWTLAGILQNKNFKPGYAKSSDEKEVMHFVTLAADGGKKEAKDYLVAYKEYQSQKRERERQMELARQQRREEEKRQKREKWLNLAGQVLNLATQTYVAVETSKMGGNVYNQGYSIPTMSYGQMSDNQFFAQNQLALQQIAQYTYNKVYSDWTGTPMVYTDMSAVNLGTDTSVGSPLWMWGMQQDINQIATNNARMQSEIVAYYRRQTDQITQQLIADPTAPIAGYVDIDGNWISHEMVEAGIDLSQEAQDDQYSVVEKIRQKNRNYYSERYGNKECHICHNQKVCQTCNGKKYYYGNLGTSTPIECPNCFIENGVRTGLCGNCQGRGYVYGLR